MTDLSSLKNTSQKRQSRKRIGRGPGSGNGKTSGRGHKGQKSRAGYSRRRGFEGGQMPLHRRLPKRGFNHGDRFPMAIVNVDTLERTFDEGTEVTSALLIETGLADACKGGVKILGRGEIKTKLTLKVNAITPSARQKIEAAGGTVELIEVGAAKNAPTDATPEQPAEG